MPTTLHQISSVSWEHPADHAALQALRAPPGLDDVIRRIAGVSRLFVDAGLIVLTAFISPFRADRATARAIMGPGEFVEIHLDTPLAICEARDPKGLYRKARAGEILNFTGIDSAYEPPEHPEIRLDTSRQTVLECAEQIVGYLTAHGYLSRDGS